jgi:hypothetical protein
LHTLTAFDCNLTFKYDDDVKRKSRRYRRISDILLRSSKGNASKEAALKFNKSGALRAKKHVLNIIQAAEVEFLKGVKGCNPIDKVKIKISGRYFKYFQFEEMADCRRRCFEYLAG